MGSGLSVCHSYLIWIEINIQSVKQGTWKVDNAVNKSDTCRFQSDFTGDST